MLKTSRTVSIYNLLKILFLAAMGGVVAVYHNVGASSYVNSTTVILSLVLCVVSLFVISDSKKKDNPLLFVFPSAFTFTLLEYLREYVLYVQRVCTKVSICFPCIILSKYITLTNI